MRKIAEEGRDEKNSSKEIIWVNDSILKSNYRIFTNFSQDRDYLPKYSPGTEEDKSYTFDIEYADKKGSKRPFLGWLIEYYKKSESRAYIIPFNQSTEDFKRFLNKWIY